MKRTTHLLHCNRSTLFTLALLIALLSSVAVADQFDVPEVLKRARSGDVKAQYALGQIYRHGYGVAKNLREAVRWFRMAAKDGHVDGQYSLGMAYLFGEGVPQDEVEAARWLLRAARRGHAAAQFTVGGLYRFGTGVPRNLDSSIYWYRKAAEQGDAFALFALGIMYWQAEGVERDLGLALAYIDLAAFYGHRDAKAARAHLVKEMTAEQRARAQKLYEEMRPQISGGQADGG